MLAESKRLENEIKTIQKQLNILPEGKLISSKKGQHYNWYQSDGHNKIYIPHNNQTLLNELAQKKYLTQLQKDLIQEKVAIDLYLHHHSSCTGKASQMLEENSRYRKLLSPFFAPTSEKLSEWMNSPLIAILQIPNTELINVLPDIWFVLSQKH